MQKKNLLCLAIAITVALTPALAQSKLAKKAAPARSLLRYEVAVSNPGSRSEGLSGKLFAGAFEFPETVKYVEAYGIRYTCTPFTEAWVWHGFAPEKSSADRKANDTRWTDADGKKGWYEGAVDAPKNGTPTVWIFVQTDTTGVWIDPDKVQQFLKSDTKK